MTPQEQTTIDKVLRRIRKTATSVDGQAYTLEQVQDGLRREAYSQEKAGATEKARLLDAADNLILALLIKLAQQNEYRAGRKHD